jgi:hypothetical protein
MTAKALGILKGDRNGFFLFVEEEGIDEFEHRNNTPKTILAGQSLDRAVAVAVRFAATHPGTLLVVAGDHATGGLAIENVDETDESGNDVSAEDGPFTVAGSDLQFVVDWTTGGHTGETHRSPPRARALARSRGCRRTPTCTTRSSRPCASGRADGAAGRGARRASLPVPQRSVVAAPYSSSLTLSPQTAAGWSSSTSLSARWTMKRPRAAPCQ